MRTALITMMAAGGLLATAATAQTAPQAPAPAPNGAARPHGGMMRADANGDGTVTRAEVIAQAQARFDAMDTNHDGTVTPEERSAARAAMWAKRGGGTGDAPAMNRGGNGGGRTLTRADATARAGARFDRMDTNHDGKLDATEMAAARSAMHHGRRGGAAPDASQPAGTPDAQ